MEDSCSVLKRKKRKTRRCLNEIRKKSRRNANNATENLEPGSKIHNKVSKMIESNCNNNYITSNRLTLAIFPKAVRSETITRPLLAEIRHEPGNINLNNIVRRNQSLNSESVPVSKENAEVLHLNNGNKNGSNMFSDERSDDSAKSGEGDGVVYRAVSPRDVADGSDGSDAGGPSPASPSPSLAPHTPRSQDLHAYRMYEQFVKNIPKYIQTHAPSLLVGDAMKKPKAILHNMYLEGRRRLRESSQLACGREPPLRAAPIVENPRDYLALWGACSSPSASPSSPSAPSPHSPPSSPSSPPTHSIIQDTPEYTYFPHKLNQ